MCGPRQGGTECAGKKADAGHTVQAAGTRGGRFLVSTGSAELESHLGDHAAADWAEWRAAPLSASRKQTWSMWIK